MTKLKPVHQNWHEKHASDLSRSDRVALAITTFAGTLKFIYIHIVWWFAWFVMNSLFVHLRFDTYPFNLLTMILSLEAILLGTLIMIGQNLQSTRDKAQAEHQYTHQEQELLENTELTKEIHALAKEIRQSLEPFKHLKGSQKIVIKEKKRG